LPPRSGRSPAAALRRCGLSGGAGIARVVERGSRLPPRRRRQATSAVEKIPRQGDRIEIERVDQLFRPGVFRLAKEPLMGKQS